MKKIRITITMTEEEATWLEQVCFIEEEMPWTKFINRVGKTARKARHAFQHRVQRTAGTDPLEDVAKNLESLARRVASSTRR